MGNVHNDRSNQTYRSHAEQFSALSMVLMQNNSTHHDFVEVDSRIIEDIPEAIHWPEYRRMLNNIGWKGDIPETWKLCKSDEKELYELVLLMEERHIIPTRIRNKQIFTDLMQKECFNDYKQYIDTNLNGNSEPIDESEIDQIENGNPMTTRNSGDDQDQATNNWCNGFENIFAGLCRC